MTSKVESSSATDAARARSKARRWVQLVLGVICMVMIANLQYGWTLFVTPMGDAHHWSRQAIQVAFTIFVATETWLVPVEGYLVDRFGPRMVIVTGGVLVALAWSLNSVASSLPFLYVAQAIGGIGAGAVYGTCLGNALKWFPERRGLAAGITAAGFGAGSALTVIPIASMIKSSGYEATFLYFGLGQGLVVFVLGCFLTQPDPHAVAALPKPVAAVTVARQFAPFEMLRTQVFWVMYVMFVLMAAGGLFVTANLKQVAEDFKVADVQVSLIGITLPAATFALSLDRVLNGLTRPLFGWISDWLGRENTMFVAFFAEAIGIFLLSQLGHDPVLFVVLSGLVFFAWGEIYSLFPSTCTDTYGWRYATANAGVLYTAKGTAALLVPLATLLAASASWHTVFLTSAAMNLSAAILAFAVLKPLRRRMLVRP
ncbi:MAG TPA: oxalate/formate MFS antiporter [Kofleriaceae bacterium]|jgi:OFA family oxalate/formate antiporter-like MFS transporter|nr:oxalate/formate MFS antiporter [Kofleriaceae bacterium]